MVVIQQPAPINFSGNLADLVLTSAVPVSLKLFKGLTLILEENYTPDADSKINIRLKDIIEGDLSVAIPTSDVYHQVTAYADFTVTLNNTQTIIFRVIKGGVDSDVIDVDVYTKANFLTWQPQTKRVKFYDPEWLTYYSKSASILKAKGYYTDSDQTITVAALPAGQLNTINANYGHLISLFTQQPLYVDIWVELLDVPVTFAQRYILSIEKFEFDDVFIFENSLGGIDTVRFTGEKTIDNGLKFESALFGDDLLDYQIKPEQVFQKNTGFFHTERECSWSVDFFRAIQKYYNIGGNLKKIIVTKPVLESVLGELTFYKFDFAYSKQTRFLNLARQDPAHPDLQIVDGDSELYFLAPNLNILQNANFDDNWLLPTQPAFESAWYKLSIGALIGYIQPKVALLVSNDILLNYDNKSQISSFFSGAAPKTGYNKTNWDTSFGWGNHASAGYANEVQSNARYVHNTVTYQPDVRINVYGGRFVKYLGLPKEEPLATDMAYGEWHIWMGSGNLPSEPPVIANISDLGDVAINTLLDSQLLRFNAAAGKWYNWTPDFTASAVPWSGISDKPTTLAGYGITDAGITETDPTVPAWVKSISQLDISNWNAYDQAFSDARYLHNNTAYKPAKFNIYGGAFNKYLAIPKIEPLPVDMEPGEWHIWMASGNLPSQPPVVSNLSDLGDVVINTLLDNQLLKFNSTVGKWYNWTPDFTASAVAWGGITDKPTTLAGYGITDAAQIQTFLGLGSAAYMNFNPADYLPLTGGTISGALIANRIEVSALLSIPDTEPNVADMAPNKWYLWVQN